MNAHIRKPHSESFSCTTDEMLRRIKMIDPGEYDKTRNYLDGAVTWLSPFLTHGITNTSEIASHVLHECKPSSCYRLLFELGWREYFHRIWQENGESIFEDMRSAQEHARSRKLPEAIVNASTGIDSVDQALRDLHSSGVMHNHARMWTAAIVCNMARTHWFEAARYFHYHLLDGDLASNTLSWQWIAGTFSHKQYVANQDNINKYSRSIQRNTWLDVPYEKFENFELPAILAERIDVGYDRKHFGHPIYMLEGEVALRSIWQLDPRWQSEVDLHIVFVDTDWLSRWPLSPNRKAFIQHWADQCNATVLYGTLDQLTDACLQASVVREEYPACTQWPGQVVERSWLYPLPDKFFNSFSQYFKQVKGSVGL